ncbi:MAG: SLC13 family permease, partial [Rhodospirillales bacterium]
MPGVEQAIQIWGTFAVIVAAFALYATERFPMEVVSLGALCMLMLLFHFFPILDDAGRNLLTPTRLLHGFANPALITVLALLVIGQGLVQAGVLDLLSGWMLDLARGRPRLSIAVTLTFVAVISGFLNNTPVVLIFIPVVQALATRFAISPSKVMMPLNYAAILGGMTTLVGSSTNLLVNSALIELQVPHFAFFDFTVPGLVLAGVGMLYVVLIAPRLLPDRVGLVESLLEGDGKQFIAQLVVAPHSPLVGKAATAGMFLGLPEMTVRMIQRDEEAILPPFEDYLVQPNDIFVVAATRKVLTETLARNVGLVTPTMPTGDDADALDASPTARTTPPSGWEESRQVVAEAMVAPASRLQGQTLRQVGFHHQTRCVVLGIQRRSRMIRRTLADMRLEAGDVLLVSGQSADVHGLKVNRDVVLLEWSAQEVPNPVHTRQAATIFLVTILSAASGIVPLVFASLAGATAMVVLRIVTPRQVTRVTDTRIIAAIGSALAMSIALQESGGATLLARALVENFMDVGPAVVLSVLFLFGAALTNVISNNAVAVLLTPIAVDAALQLEVSPQAFAVAVIFAANCPFASPIGYQTNLLVL